MRREWLGRLLVAAALIALPGLALALEDESLLTSDGTLHAVRAGRALDLGVTDGAASPDNNVIEWTSLAQDGTLSTAIIPGTDSQSVKLGLQLAFDDQTGTLLVLWTEDMSGYSQIRVGVFRGGAWTNWGLLPNEGISRAYNPQMQVTHQPVTYLDAQGNTVAKTSSILSIIWWEDAQFGQARFATLFLDENSFDPANLAIYDIPELLGGGGATPYTGIPSGAYMYPSLQLDGLSGGILISYADLHDGVHRVVRISFPSDQGQPSNPGSLSWKRRHIPIYGVATQGPIARMAPVLVGNPELGVGTSIGSGYRPTLYWRDGDYLKFTRLEGTAWTAVRSMGIDDTTTYEKALSLVVGMGSRY